MPLVSTRRIALEQTRLTVAVHPLYSDRPRALDLNNGLLAAGDADIVAYLDDDCRRDERWLDALAEAWANADDDVAVIGGPIDVQVDGRRPAWCSDALLCTFATQSEPGATFHAGNASFRTAALRGVGGFWPARGHALGRDWFAPEHEAQRELQRAGWRSAWAPDALVTRHLTPRLASVMHTRLRTGARNAVMGTPKAQPLRAALTSAAGVALTRSPEIAGDRAARAFEHVGMALGSRLVAADFDAITSSTPFRASVPLPPKRRRAVRRARRGPQSLVLLYHRVIDKPYGPAGLCVTPQNFAAQLEVLGDALVGLDHVIAGDVPDRSVAITFDDGYIDNLTHAAPLLDGRPATLFVCTGLERFWWDDLWRLARELPDGRVAIGDRAWWPRSDEQRAYVAGEILTQLVAAHPDDVADAMGQLGPIGDAPEDRRMTVDELRVAATSFAIGAHTRRHPSLAKLPAAEQYAEMTGSREDLKRWLGVDARLISYPYGVPGCDVDAVTIRAARAAGFAGGVVNGGGTVAAGHNPFAVPRVPAPDLGADAFAQWLRGVRGVTAAAVLS